MKRILFNATNNEELRVAIIDGKNLLNFEIETKGKELKKGNIYKGVITKIEPSLEACFVDYGEERQGFLPFKEINRIYYQNDSRSRVKIQDVIKEGLKVLIQIDKDERSNKGAAVTTNISLAGRYLVLMPLNPRSGGISRRVEGESRQELKELIAKLSVPKGMSIIARSAAIARNIDELSWDLEYLTRLWGTIWEAFKNEDDRNLVLQESALFIRSVRDYFQPDIDEIIVDKEDLYKEIKDFVGLVMPNNTNKVKFFKNDESLFARYHVEDQIESAFNREVKLESGGSIVIDRTEALVAIDVNSSKSRSGADVEETAVKTNLEAAVEIAKQIRFRDLGGLIVIDFIDMTNVGHQREVEKTVRESLKDDKARVQVGRISKFGLMELSRQRMQAALDESSYISCPRCQGVGFIRNIESSALMLLRLIQQKIQHTKTIAIQVQVPVDVATFLLNEKRKELYFLEEKFKKPIILIPNEELEFPNYKITKLTDNSDYKQLTKPSYKLKEQIDELDLLSSKQDIAEEESEDKNSKSPIVNMINYINQAPKLEKVSILKNSMNWIKNLITKKDKEEEISISSSNNISTVDLKEKTIIPNVNLSNKTESIKKKNIVRNNNITEQKNYVANKKIDNKGIDTSKNINNNSDNNKPNIKVVKSNTTINKDKKDNQDGKNPNTKVITSSKTSNKVSRDVKKEPRVIKDKILLADNIISNIDIQKKVDDINVFVKNQMINLDNNEFNKNLLIENDSKNNLILVETKANNDELMDISLELEDNSKRRSDIKNEDIVNTDDNIDDKITLEQVVTKKS